MIILQTVIPAAALALILIGIWHEEKLIAFEDLGAEALRELYVEDMPLMVIIDSEGNNLYELGREEYLASKK